MKKIVSLVLAALLMLAAIPSLADGYPVTIQNYNYEKEPIEQTLEKAPERVIVAYQNNIEIMLKLGLADRILCAFGLDEEITGELAEEFAKINYLDARPSTEDVLGMEPDAIIAWRSLFGEKRLGDVDFWNERGIFTYMSNDSGALPAADGGQTIAAEMDDILKLGRMFDVEDKAQAIVDEMQAEIDRITNYVLTSGVAPQSIAILEDEGESCRVYGTTTIGGNIAETVGATLAVGAENSENIGAEDLIEADPDIIFMIWYEGYFTPEQAVAVIMDNPAFASLSAVQNGKVYPLNLTAVYCSGLHTLDGIKIFAEALYPELYAD